MSSICLVAVMIAGTQAILLSLLMRSRSLEDARQAIDDQRARGVAISFDLERFDKIAAKLRGVAAVASSLLAVIVVALAKLLFGDMSWRHAVMIAATVGIPVAISYTRRLAVAYVITQSAIDRVELVSLD